jgi:uncharacterized protein (TIGR00255 family)
MTRSMTAFASGVAETEFGRLTCEIRSVNHRFLDASIKQPDLLRNTEPAIRKVIAAHLSRGKVDVFIRFYPDPHADIHELSLNQPLLEQLQRCAQAIESSLPGNVQEINVIELMAWPQLLVQSPRDTAPLNAAVLELVETVVKDLNDARLREGKQLEGHLRQRLQSIRAIHQELSQHIEQIQQQLREKLLSRLADLDIDFNPERLEQELAFQLQRLDIAEELDRLATHCDEIERILESEKPIGRKLDFLIQELHREANTIGSKSAAIQTTGGSVDLKVAIEQMREQVQNIE